ncbi:hypothetical protein [Lactiplantibacillus plantarum]|uniref:hypothetical protein n=1 Tax=Lactiplantibacillus plantarum TaxID=1590 RepID=UPI00214CE4B3|nr:hypothetical protein [Lactiplantibacillus plantarum]
MPRFVFPQIIPEFFSFQTVPSLNGIIQMYQEIAGQQLEIKRAEQRGGEVDHSVASIGKLARLNYESEWPLRRGLTKYWEGECEHARS